MVLWVGRPRSWWVRACGNADPSAPLTPSETSSSTGPQAAPLRMTRAGGELWFPTSPKPGDMGHPRSCCAACFPKCRSFDSSPHRRRPDDHPNEQRPARRGPRLSMGTPEMGHPFLCLFMLPEMQILRLFRMTRAGGELWFPTSPKPGDMGHPRSCGAACFLKCRSFDSLRFPTPQTKTCPWGPRIAAVAQDDTLYMDDGFIFDEEDTGWELVAALTVNE